MSGPHSNRFYRQPEPERDPVTEAVKADLDARQQRGQAKYGTTMADNPLPLRAWLEHAYEEALDMAQYLKRAMMEMDAKEKQP
jgi:hypothetical protein